MAWRSTQRRSGGQGTGRADLDRSKRLRAGRSTSGAGVSPRLIAVFALSTLLSVLLVFLAPGLRSVPLVVQVTLIGLCALFFPIQARLANRPHRPLLAARVPFLMACGLAVATQIGFVFAGVYFSDDSVRHMYDGFQLLRGQAIYVDPPAVLGRVEGMLPNHPELASIYLPFTQLQATLGAAMHARLGFPIVYHLLLAILLSVCFWELPSRGRRLLVVLALSPFFLIVSASRHADVQGMTLAILSMALAEKRKRGRDLAAGVAASLLAGLKPIGSVWACFLLVDLILRRGRLPRAWLCGAVLGTLGLVGFAVGWLWKDTRSLAAFLDTARFFADWFIAYNPFVILRAAISDGDQRGIIVAFRREILTLLFGGFLFMPLLTTARMVGSITFPGGPRLIRRVLREGLVWVLVMGVLAAGVWHPWYFLWWIPALWLSGRFRAAAFLPGLLVLFYIPVAALRLTGRWEYDLFVFSLFFYVPAWFWLTRNRRIAVT